MADNDDSEPEEEEFPEPDQRAIESIRREWPGASDEFEDFNRPGTKVSEGTLYPAYPAHHAFSRGRPSTSSTSARGAQLTDRTYVGEDGERHKLGSRIAWKAGNVGLISFPKKLITSPAGS